MSDVATDVQRTEECASNDTVTQPKAGKAVTTRNFRIDRGHSRISRAEETLRTLRQRIERHLDQEVRLGQLYQGWQQHWSSQCDEMHRQLAYLEAHLSAWLPLSQGAPMLTVVDGE